MSHFAVAGIQMGIGMQNNIHEMQRRLEILMHLYPWVEMVVFSELAVHGPAHHSAQPMGGSFETAFQSLAKKHGIWLIPGSMFEKRDGKVYNMSPVINPEGEIITRYRKMFPFTPYEENVTPGEEFCVFDVPNVGRFGLSICYDMWFPELTRTLVSMGAEVIINPVLASFIDRPADLAIVQASAAMFQSYVVSINGLYAGGNGYSMVVDPAGQIIHRAGVGEELIPVEIDLNVVRRQRERGLRNMGQPLKSFRDRPVTFDVYSDNFDHSYLNSLGPVGKPTRAALPPANHSAPAAAEPQPAPPLAGELSGVMN